MTDPQLPGDLEDIAAALPSIPPEFAELRALLARIPSLTAPEVQGVRQTLLDPATGAGGVGGGLSLVSQTAPGSESGALIGREAPHFYGPANLLFNPRFENFPGTGTVGAGATTLANGTWVAEHNINAGSMPSPVEIDRLYSVGETSNPFNSAVLELNAELAASSNVDILLWQVVGSGGVNFGFSHLVAACMVAGPGFTDPNLTVAQVYIEIVDDGTGTVIATSVAHNLLTSDWTDNPHRIWTSVENDPTIDTRWRLRFHFETNAGGGSFVGAVFGDPLMHYGYTEQPEAYAPIAARWVPDKLEVYEPGATTPSISIGPQGIAIGGTTFPASVPTNGLWFRTDLDLWFFHDGTRWLSTEVFQTNIPTNPVAHSASNVSVGFAALSTLGHGGSDLWIEDCEIFMYINTGGTALDGSNSWTVTVEKNNNGSSTFTSIDTMVADSGGNTSRREVTAINALYDGGTTRIGIRVGVTKVGTPGTLITAAKLTYRIVAT